MALFSAVTRSLTSTFKSSLTQVRGVASSRMQVHHLDMGLDRSLAFKELPGNNYPGPGGAIKPTVVMVPGLHAHTHMDGGKTACILRYCDLNDFPCVVYDHECTGQSKGDTKQLMFSHWVEDANNIIDRLTKGPVLLVGSSLGAWVALKVAEDMWPERLYGLVLFSPALNYVWPYYMRHVANLPAKVRERLEAGDIHVHTHEFGNAMLKKDFALESKKYEINLDREGHLEIPCPVRIITSLNDKETDPSDVVRLMKAIKSDDVDLIYKKSSTHQFDTAMDFELLLNTVDKLMIDKCDRPMDGPWL